jgi:SAM-dependent methyltransferase
MNYFSPKSAAARYLKGRPRFHPLIVRKIRESLSIEEPLARALDVGCGTGLSAVALKEISRQVVGLDASREMIALAGRESGVEYVVASAEACPFGEEEFDLITLSQVFHWLDRDRFLREAHRVLRAGGWLIVYDNYFKMTDARFQSWHREEYLKRYPDPPRPKVTFTHDNTDPYGFRVYKEELLDNEIWFSLKGLIDYLVSQSNIIAAVESGKETIASVRSWLTAALEPLFGEEQRRGFIFKAPVWQLRKSDG